MENIEIKFASIQQNEAPVVPTIFDKKTNKKWINWGEDNKMPQYIWDSYLKCSNLQAIINSFMNYITGNGIKIHYTGKTNEYSIEDTIEKCIFDYVLFGGLPEGRLCVYSGLPHSGKTTAALAFPVVLNER